MNQEEQQDRAWELLIHARKVEPSPLFARNVVREVRKLAAHPESLRERLWRLFSHRAFLAGSVACAALALSLSLLSDRSGFTDPVRTLAVVAVAENYEVSSDSFDPSLEMAAVEYLGQLMAVVDPGQLDDAALADLFF